MTQERTIAAYEAARERYAQSDVDTDKAIKSLKGISLSLHCWQVRHTLSIFLCSSSERFLERWMKLR